MAIERSKPRATEEAETSVQPKKSHNKITDSYAHRVKAQLDAQKKVKILIPFNVENPNDDIAVVNVSGCKYQIPRGVEYEVPEEVARVWNESYVLTLRAESKIKFNKGEPVGTL